MTGFLIIPEDLLAGKTLNQIVIEQNSLRMDFSGDVYILTQSYIDQSLINYPTTTYKIGDKDSDMLLAKFLGSTVSGNLELCDESCTIRFAQHMSLTLHVLDDRKYDSVTFFINGVGNYIVA